MVDRKAFSVILRALAISLLLGTSGCSLDSAFTGSSGASAYSDPGSLSHGGTTTNVGGTAAPYDDADNPSYSGRTSNTAIVSWTPPTERTDGSALTDLAGYRVYFGQSLNAMTNIIDVQNPGQTSQFIDDLETGTWYFAVTAFTTDGLESEMSDLAAKRIL